HREVLDVSDATSTQLGGSLRGSARVRLGREPRIVSARVDARNLDLSRSPILAPFAAGIVSGHFEAHGPVSRPTARGEAQIAGLQLGGDEYRKLELGFRADADGSQSLALDAERDDGGSLVAAVTRDRYDNLGGALTLRALPLESLRWITDTPATSPVGGLVEAELSLGGTVEAPTADGTITLARTWFGQAFLGAADLDIRRAGDGLLAVDGHLFQGKLGITGTIETRAPFRTLLTIDARRVEIDHFIPSLVDDQEMRGWFSGTIMVDTELLPMPGHKPKASMRLTELTLLRDAVDLEGRPAPIRLRNRSVVNLDWDGVQVVLREPAVFQGPAGDLTITGSASPEALALRLTGDVAVSMLQPYLDDYFSRTSGVVHARINVKGPMSAPEISGRFDFDQVTLTPVGQDATVSIPQGVLTVEEKQVAITDIIVRVDDPETKERTELKIWGGVRMKEWVPESWTVNVRGHLAGKMLLAAAPSVFSQAGGTAYLALKLEGDGKVPDNLGGSLWFECPRQGRGRDPRVPGFRRGQLGSGADAGDDVSDDPFNDDLGDSIESACDIKQPLSFMARGFRRQVMFTTGHIALKRDKSTSGTSTKHRLVLNDIGGWLDEEGLFEHVSGFVAFRDWKLHSYELTASAQAVPLRIPKTLDLTVSVPELAISGTDRNLSIAGDVEIIDGRYIRKFNLVSGFLTPERTSESEAPFYETIPLLANAKLKLRLETRAFFVENNIANVGLTGGLTLTGTPANPRLDGVINVEQGTFKMPGMRATFTRTGGSVTFSPRQTFPEDTPNLDVKSEADFRDSSGQEHVIHLELTGTLDNFNFNLYTDTGLNKGQTLTLISSGRTADDLRQSLGDDPIGRDPTRLDTGDGTSGTVYDEILKDLAGDFISLLIEDKLRDITKLDVARLEIGTTSVGFHAEKELFDNFRLTGDLQKNLRAFQWNARGELRMSDGFSLEGEWLQLNQTDDAEEDKSEGRLRGVWRKGWQ
ncbi:MAG TPA: translocation/assembly module TamB domain-containing protein, partial [Kofleriaceae bacterium]|nr:translocation/assembly module TamB domain-containing protein [Kofleriaceae bacterium]